MSESQQPKKHRILPIVIGLIVLIGLFACLCVRRYTLPSNSMAPTLNEGDNVVVLKTYVLPYAKDDIVVFSYNDTNYIKRVVACPGNKVEINDGIITVNGEKVASQSEQIENAEGTWDLADGEYFVMGDNQAESQEDSWTIGPVKADQIVGKLVLKC